MQVYLIRHAIAFDRDRKRWADDRLRPLTSEGMKKFRKAAAGLERLAGAVGFVLTSPLVRARQTAEILAAVAGWPQAREAPELAPDGTPEQALAVIRARTLAEPVDCVAVVGHEPNLTELVAMSIAGPRVRLRCDLKKGGAACLSFPADVRAGEAQLDWLITPKALRALGGR